MNLLSPLETSLDATYLHMGCQVRAAAERGRGGSLVFGRPDITLSSRAWPRSGWASTASMGSVLVVQVVGTLFFGNATELKERVIQAHSRFLLSIMLSSCEVC